MQIKLSIKTVCFIAAIIILTDFGFGQSTINNEWVYEGKVDDYNGVFMLRFDFLRTIVISKDSSSILSINIKDSIYLWRQGPKYFPDTVFYYNDLNAEAPGRAYLRQVFPCPSFSEYFNYDYSTNIIPTGRNEYNNDSLFYFIKTVNLGGSGGVSSIYNSMYIQNIGPTYYKTSKSFHYMPPGELYETTYSLVKYNGIPVYLGGITNIKINKKYRNSNILSRNLKNNFILKINGKSIDGLGRVILLNKK